MKNKITFKKSLPSVIIRVGMPLITAVFAYILSYILNTPENDTAWMIYTAYTMLEYALMSFVLVFCGAVIAYGASNK